MKILVFSHSYQEPENKKNIIIFRKYVTVQTVLQDYWMDLNNNLVLSQDDHPHIFKIFPSIRLYRSQYLLLTIDMGLRCFKPDIIHLEYNPWSVMFIQALICKKLFCTNAKLVCLIKKNTFREHSGFYGKLRKQFAKRTLAMSDHIFAASKMVSKLLRNKFGIAENKIDIVHHLGVDTKLFSPGQSNRPQHSIIIGYCGRLELHKGVMDLIESVKIVRQDRNCSISIYLKLLGAGNLKTDLEKMHSNMPWLEIYPAVPNREVIDFLHKLDIFVLPSRVFEDHQEHDAHALMEAMSVGLACIGCRSGIIPEILEEGAGILVDPESPKELAICLNKVIQNDEDRQRLGELARKKAEKEFSIDVIVRRKYKLFSSLLEK
jgi:glycosyltransferase involved in cell wall biosynthesis